MNRATVVLGHLNHGQNPGPAALSANGASSQQRRHKGSMPREGTKAVIFDMGGVLLPSPGQIFRGKSIIMANMDSMKCQWFERKSFMSI